MISGTNLPLAGVLASLGAVVRPGRMVAAAVMLLGLMGAALVSPAAAQPVTEWIGAGGNALWHTPGNWSGGAVPNHNTVIVTSTLAEPQADIRADASITGSLNIGSASKEGFVGIFDNSTFTRSAGPVEIFIGSGVNHSTLTVADGSKITSTGLGFIRVGEIGPGSPGTPGSGKLFVESGGSISGAQIFIADAKDSIGEVTVTGVGSSIFVPATQNNTGWVSVGFAGKGTLNILNGGVVTSEVGALATMASGDAKTTVDGSGSLWTIYGGVEFHVGGRGKGELDILNGGVVDAQTSPITIGGTAGGANSGKGTVTVDGAGSSLTNTTTVSVGINGGTGTLTASNGGNVTTGVIHIAQGAGSTGTLNIGAAPPGAPVAPGTINASSIQFGGGKGVINFNHTDGGYVFGVPISGSGGEVNVLAGTTIFTADNTYTGNTTIASGAELSLGNGGTTGNVVGPIFNSGILAFNHSNTFIVPGVIAGTGAVEQNGTGTTILTADNLYTGGTTINAGALQLGNGGLSGSIIGDVTNNATLIFNRSNVYDFTGTISGNGGVAQNGTGTTIFNTPQSYTGTTNINAGTLEVNSTLASPSVNVNAGGTLSGIGDLAGHVVNAGTVAPGTSAGGFGTLTVASYAGLGGTLAIDTQLGDDNSPTDVLKVTGDTSGNTNVKVTNRDGKGAQTVQGIEIVDVGGASNGNFTLLGDYTFFGAPAVIGGAYAYTLQKGADGNWYLRSTLEDVLSGLILPPNLPPNVSPNGPILHPGSGVYEAYPQILLGLMNMGTLRERVGNRYLAGGPVYGASAAYADADMSYLRGPMAEYVGASERVDTGTAWWGHVEGRRARIEPSSSTAGATYHVDEVNLKTGIDAQIRADASGRLIGGFNVQHATAWARTRSFWGDGKIDVDALGLGGTLTWFGANGFYVDGQARVVVFNTDLRSSLAGPLGDDENATGYGTSVEVGRRFAFAGPWAVTPQAQLSYTGVRGDLVDNFGSAVSIDDGESLIGRLGLAIDYRSAWLGSRGPTSTYVYGIANVYREFLDGTTVSLAGLPFHMENDRLWGGLGIGGTYSWAGDRYALYGEVSYNTSLDNFGDSYSVNGIGGFRIRW